MKRRAALGGPTSIRAGLRWLAIDPYLLAILVTVGVAALALCRGAAAGALSLLAKAMIGLLFFLYGARLAPQAVWQGLVHWRLHALIMAGTFVLFPLLGLTAGALVPSLLSPELYLGVLFLCTLPSPVNSAIAFTAAAGGNLPAALCAGSASSLIGLVATPLLVAVLLHSRASGLSLASLEGVLLQLLLPFVAGQTVRPWIGERLRLHGRLAGLVDRGVILLIVYAAVSAGVVGGAWQRLGLGDLGGVLLVDVALLALALACMTLASRWLGFSRQDEIAIVFCGSNKSLVIGVPMLAVLLPAQAASLAVVPLLLFHQIQLVVSAALAAFRRSGH